MGLETGTYVSDLVASNPTSSDFTSQGDDHLRLMKAVLQATLPNASKAFRFPVDVAEKTGAYTVVFPDDQNKIIPVDTTSGNITITLPAPSGVNANGWSFRVVKNSSDTNTVTISGTINGDTNYVLRREWEAVEIIWLDASSAWMAIPIYAEFASATKMIFAQSSAPSGWTKETGAAYNNAALRNVTGSVTPTGGTANFTSAFTSRTIAQANLPNVSLTAAAGGAHNHSLVVGTSTNTATTGGGARVTDISTGVGGGGEINVSTSDTHTHSVSLGGSGTAMDFAVKYVDTILCTKD